jgi:hypothetical protein
VLYNMLHLLQHMLDFAHIYLMNAVFDTPEDVPEEVRLLRCYITCYILLRQEVLPIS